MGEIEILGGIGDAEGLAEISSHLLPHGGETGGGGIGVQLLGRNGAKLPLDAFGHAGRGRDAGVADGEVKDIFRAHFLGAAVAKGGQVPDDAPLGAPFDHAFRDHLRSSFKIDCFKSRMAWT